MTLIVSAADVRAYLELEANNPTGSSMYTDATIESNILAAQETLEHATQRWFVNRTGVTYTSTTNLRVIVPIPGFRTFTSITWGGSLLDPTPATASVWPLPDVQQTGVYTALQFRALRADPAGMPWYLADQRWWDKALDNPFYPGNYGGGYAYTSMPNDLVIVGDAGYAPGSEPYQVRHAVKVLGSFYTKRPAAILANVVITAQGGVINYADMPSEVADFITAWRAGSQAVSVG